MMRPIKFRLVNIIQTQSKCDNESDVYDIVPPTPAMDIVVESTELKVLRQGEVPFET